MDEEHDGLLPDGSEENSAIRISFRGLVVRRLLQAVAILSAAALLFVGLTWTSPSFARTFRLSGVLQLADKGIYPLIRGGTRMFGEDDEDNFVCVGHVLSAGAWLSAAALKINAAVVECDRSRYGVNVSVERRVADTPEVRAGLCARDILGHMRDLAQTSQLLEGAATACNDKKVKNIRCATSVTNALRQSFHTSRFMSELSVYCPVEEKNVFNLFICINRVEGVGWALDAMLVSISAAARFCDTNEKRVPATDIGSCVGEVIGGAAYVAAAGMNIWSAADFECFSAQDPRDVINLTQEEKDEINARCALFSTATARTFAIATSKVTEAAGHCGASGKTNCGRSLTLGAAALSGAAEAMSNMRLECISPLSCCEEVTRGHFQCDCTGKRILEIREANAILRQRCARFTASTLKNLAVAVSLISEGTGECTEATASLGCSSFISGAMAGFFFLVEAISRTTVRCKDDLDRFFCSQDIGFIGESVDLMTHALGAALRDCGFGAAPMKSNWLNYGRRFFLP